MFLNEFRKIVADYPNRNVRFGFSDGGQVEAHCHVTEIGLLIKDFVDCGGSRRNAASCVLQTFVADDVDHRLGVATLGKILRAGEVLNLQDDLPVEVEYQSKGSNRGTIGVFEVSRFRATDEELIFELKAKATACLAPDRCGIDDMGIGNEEIGNVLPQLSGGT